jgi:hypothetical protein
MPVIISDNLVVPSSSGLPPFPLSNARIGYQSIVTEDNITATSQAAGFPVVGVTNGLTYEQWRAEVDEFGASDSFIVVELDAPTDADYFGIAGHNLSNVGGVIQVQYSFDGDTWITLQELSPGDNSPIMLLFATITASFWRLHVTTINGQPSIGVIKIGEALSMQRPIYGGVTPVTMARQTDYQNNRSETAQFLGRTAIRRGINVSLSWRHLTSGWYRQFFEPFALFAREEAFFLAWRPDRFPREVGYFWTTNDITPTNMGIRDYMEVSLELQGLGDA